MQVSEIIWSETEKRVADQAFKRANEREIATLIKHVNQKATENQHIEELWQLHDFLSAKRHQIDGKYDYRLSDLIFVFAELLKEGWLTLDDLAGLEPDKLAKIAALAKM